MKSIHARCMTVTSCYSNTQAFIQHLRNFLHLAPSNTRTKLFEHDQEVSSKNKTRQKDWQGINCIIALTHRRSDQLSR